MALFKSELDGVLASRGTIDDETAVAVDAELLALALRAGNVTVFLILLVTTALGFSLDASVPTLGLAVWATAMVVCAVVRVAHARWALARLEAAPASIRRHRRGLLAVITVSGVVFSSVFVFFHGHLTPAQTVAVVIAIAGFAAGGLSTLGPVPSIQVAYTLVLVVPVGVVEAVRAVRAEDVDHGVVAFCTVAFVVMLAASVRRLHARMYASIALAYENRRLLAAVEEANSNLRSERDEFHEQATVDGLTGLANRRSFDEHLQREWSHCRSLGVALAVALIDIDHFKPYNDNRGHAAGDRCLQRVGGLLRDVAGRLDGFAARYGGEEFVVVWSGADGDEAMQRAEVVRTAVAERALAHGSSPVASHVTVSVGCAAARPSERASAALLLKAADVALYAAKRAGRNTVVLADDDTFAEAETAIAEATSVTQLQGEAAPRRRPA